MVPNQNQLMMELVIFRRQFLLSFKYAKQFFFPSSLSPILEKNILDITVVIFVVDKTHNPC